jgi:DNA adenine methylase
MRHVEPFAGGAAFFFSRAPKRALLCDVNPTLVATYRAVRDDVESVIAELQPLAKGHDEARYYALRERYNHHEQINEAERAALFIYLNKTCFNGLHRVNQRGEFNVPVGRYENPRILDSEGLRTASLRLQRSELRCESFEGLLESARPGDFVYLDPPYEPVSRTASFTAYAKGGFGQDMQARLRDVFAALDKRRCRLMLSNSDTPLIRELYRRFKLDVVAAPRAINCDGRGRGKVAEIVVRNY